MSAPREFNAMTAGCSRLMPAVIITFSVLLVLICGWSALIFWLTETGLVSNEVALAIGIPVLMIVTLGGAVVAMVFVYTRLLGQLSAAFTPLGMKRIRWLFNITHYQGMFDGRRVKAGFREDRMANITLHIAIEARLPTPVLLGTRGAFVTTLTIRRNKNMQVLPLADPAFAHLSGSAHDEHWANTLLNTPEAREALLRLTRSTGANDIHLLAISPSGIKLMLQNIRMQEITAQNVGAWINDLLVVTHTAEQLAPPTERLEPTRWDQAFFAPENQETIIRIVVFAAAAVTICLISVAVIGLALLSLAGGV